MFGARLAALRRAIRRIREAPAAASVLLTFSLALVLEGLMGLIWGNTSHAVRPRVLQPELHRRRRCSCPKAQVYGCLVAIGVLLALYLVLDRARGPGGRSARARSTRRARARRRERRGGGDDDVRDRRRDAPAPAARSSACSIRSCPARTTSGSRACSGSSSSAAWAACPARSSARCCSASAESLTVHLHLAAVGDRGALRRDLRRAARCARRACSGARLREDVAAA